MYRKLTSLILSSLFTLAATAQINIQWESRHTSAGANIDRVSDMVVDGTGNVYVTGADWGAAQGFNYRTIKYNNVGSPLWSSSYDAAGFLDEPAAIAIDASGNVYVTGQSAGAGLNYDVATVKYNSAGAQQWVRRFNGTNNGYDRGVDVTVDGNGDIIVVGEVDEGSAPLSDYVVIKYSAAGAVLWSRKYDGPGGDIDAALKVVTDAANNVYVAGHSSGSGTDLDIHVIKYNSAGTQVWQARYNNAAQNKYDTPVDMTLDGNGGVYVTGISYGGSSDADYATLKINPSGAIAWVKRFDGTKSDYDKPARIKLGPLGRLYIPGRTTGDSTAEDMTLLVYDTLGNQIWRDDYNGSNQNYDEATDVVFDASDYIYMTGYSYTAASNNDYTTIKYDTTGAQVWLTKFNGTANNSDQAWVMDIDAGANIYVSGTSRGSGTGEDFSTIKYCQFEISAGNDTSICAGTSAQLKATGSSTGYAWWPSGGLSDTTSATPVATPSVTTKYYVRSTNANGCTDEDTVIVYVNPAPSNNITPNGSTTMCAGDSLMLTADSAASYLWSTTDTTRSILVKTGGTYSVTVGDTLGCSNTGNIVITVNPLPNIDAGQDIHVCLGDSVQLNVTGGTGYTWSTQLGINDSTIANPWFNHNAAQTYFIWGSDANNCKNVDTLVVFVDPVPTAAFQSNTDSTYINKGGLISFFDNSVNPASWSWNFGDGSTSTSQNPIHTYTTPGAYRVCLTVTLGSCPDSICDSVWVFQTDFIGELNGLRDYKVYPNPVKDELNIQLISEALGTLNATVIDPTGRIVYNELWQNTGGKTIRKIDMSAFDAGVYTLIINNEQGRTATKVIKY